MQKAIVNKNFGLELTDKIIKGCINKNRNDQKALYQTYSKKMFAVCLRYARDYTEAEDMLQEGFIKVFENVKSFKFQGSFEGWVRRVIVNTALEKLRKQNILYPVNDIYEYANEAGYEDILDSISAKDLIKLIQELSPKYRLVFNLYAIEGYSHQEVGEKLGISVGTSKSNLSRARQILQDRIKDLYDAEPNKLKIVP
jgi:RNA polymerase sigma factor (sigma-70 family)